MTTFSVRNRSEGAVAADRVTVWKVLTDPVLLTRLTPYLTAIDDEGGDRWRWHLTRVPVLASAVSPSFTEQMTFDEPHTIRFAHDPDGARENAGVDGVYHLEEAGDGTWLSIDLTICVDLPLPRLARPAVETAMRAVVAVMGQRFSHNLLRHLGEAG
jgi:carbon monoxide dehydrogenase subunit G